MPIAPNARLPFLEEQRKSLFPNVKYLLMYLDVRCIIGQLEKFFTISWNLKLMLPN